MRLAALSVPTPSPSPMSLVAKSLAMGSRFEAVEFAETSNASDKVISTIKTAVPLSYQGGDLESMQDARYVSNTFVPQLKNRSLFFRLLADLVPAPFRTRISSTTLSATAYVAGEGLPIPVSKLTLTGAELVPHRAAAIVVLSNELARSAGAAGESFLANEIKRGAALATDAKLLSLIVDGSTPSFASTGPTSSDAILGLRCLLNAVQPTSESRLFLALAPDVARAAATLVGELGNLTFNMSPTSGTMCNIDAMAVDTLQPGTAMLIDSSEIAGALDLIVIDRSTVASIEMSDAPSQDGTSGTGTTMLNLFQTNAVALMCRVFFGAERVRDNAVAVLTGITWGGDLPTS